MSSLILPRRKFITGVASLLLTPAVVKASSLMPIGAIHYGVSEGVREFVLKQTTMYAHRVDHVTMRVDAKKVLRALEYADPTKYFFQPGQYLGISFPAENRSVFDHVLDNACDRVRQNVW